MKKIVAVLLVLLSALVLSGCATPQAPSVQVKPVSEHNREVVAPINTQSMTEIVTAKLSGLTETELRKVNSFLDYLWEVSADPRKEKEIMVMVVKKKVEFPPFLDEIMSKHPKLNKLPRDPSTLYLVESPRVPGVQNIFIKVPGSYVGDKNNVFTWMPDAAEWRKYMDLKANKLEKKSHEDAFLILFAKANELLSPALIAPVEGEHLPFEQQWDWSRIPGNIDMYIPLATNNKILTKFFKQ
jgi:hypothetical protein